MRYFIVSYNFQGSEPAISCESVLIKTKGDQTAAWQEFEEFVRDKGFDTVPADTMIEEIHGAVYDLFVLQSKANAVANGAR